MIIDFLHFSLHIFFHFHFHFEHIEFCLISKNLHIFSSIFAIHSFSPPPSFLLNVRQQQQHDTAVVGHWNCLCVRSGARALAHCSAMRLLPVSEITSLPSLQRAPYCSVSILTARCCCCRCCCCWVLQCSLCIARVFMCVCVCVLLRCERCVPTRLHDNDDDDFVRAGCRRDAPGKPGSWSLAGGCLLGGWVFGWQQVPFCRLLHLAAGLNAPAGKVAHCASGVRYKQRDRERETEREELEGELGDGCCRRKDAGTNERRL